MLGRRNYLFAGSDAAGETTARLYSLIGTCPCRMRHGQVHAERLTMPNEGSPMRENGDAPVFAIVEGISVTRHSRALHRPWRNCSKRSGGRYRPLDRPFKIGTFASAASLSAI